MYPSIKEAKQAHEIIACTGERCGKKDGMTILQNLRRELGIKKDGISSDGRFELRTRNCLKQCRTSPNMYIDRKLYSGEQLKDIKTLLNNICILYNFHFSNILQGDRQSPVHHQQLLLFHFYNSYSSRILSPFI